MRSSSSSTGEAYREPRTCGNPSSHLLPESTMTFISRIVAKPAFRSSFQPITRISIASRSYAMGHSVPPLNDPSLFKQQAFINGKWVDAKSGQTFDVYDPATHKAIGKMPEMSKEDAQLAIDAAAAAFPSFRKTTARERSKMLRKWYDLMVENAEDIAKLITWENGKPMADAKGEATYAANFFEWFSEEAPRAYGDTISATVAGNRVFTLKEPVGVCGLITPWNFPAAMITRKIGPALAAGCTVVAKSPGETPFTAAALAELSVRAGIPPGVVNIITAMKNTPEVGEAITSSDIVKKVSFTGSTGVGKLLMKQSADTLKKLSFELGGNAPFIVFDDADLEVAVNGAIASKFRSSGQTCVCANRLYVQRGIYDKFAEAFVAKVKDFKVGHGYDEGVTHGPLIHDRAVSKVEAHVQDAVKQGGKVLIGGQKLPDLGDNFFQPTVIRDMTSDMALAHEETFGPVAGLFPFDTEAEVVKLANDADVGLAGYFFSRDIQRVYRVAEALEVGMVGVNTGLISDPAAPFGGVKQSGFGREGSKIGIDEYMVTKMVTLGGMGQPLQGE
ncbi:succinic semialdehyde dehydrogenase [Aureobasidium pullulans]|nr:succinic semialdehyde dehydrogenase [Aureobasidium pullulans]THY11596.1 succinic semialdehyde dehydrogenase [Aureobasidium pullulans]